MTRMNRLPKVLIAVAALTFAISLATLSSAEDSSKDQAAKTAPAIGAPTPQSLAKPTDNPTSDTQSPSDRPFSEIATWEWVSRADITLSKSLVEPQFDKRKAELDIREAKAVLAEKKSLYESHVEVNKRNLGAISQHEVDRLKLDVDVAEVQLEKAELELQRTKRLSSGNFQYCPSGLRRTRGFRVIGR